MKWNRTLDITLVSISLQRHRISSCPGDTHPSALSECTLISPNLQRISSAYLNTNPRHPAWRSRHTNIRRGRAGRVTTLLLVPHLRRATRRGLQSRSWPVRTSSLRGGSYLGPRAPPHPCEDFDTDASKSQPQMGVSSASTGVLNVG